MSLLSKRTSAPLAVLALAAVPLLAPAGANAAMAGALPANSSQGPDLQSATGTIVGNNAEVRYCFNKNLGSSVTPSNFTIGTYDQVTRQANTAVVSGQCVTAQFIGLNDITTYTYGSVAGGAAVNQNLPVTNNADSTALVGSNTNNGTRSRTTAPDLTGVSVQGSTVIFAFDEGIAYAPAANTFSLIDGNGGTIASNPSNVTLSSDRKSVSVDFGIAPQTVLSAARAVYTPSGVPANNIVSASSGKSTPVSAGATPTSNGTTSIPDPTGATLVSNGSADQIDVAFDQQIATVAQLGTLANNPGQYQILLSDGSTIAANTATFQTQNSVRLQSAAGVLRSRAEYVVGVVVTGTTAVAPGAAANTVGVVPAGGNPGALATGYTTAPEVVRTVLDGPTNTATITLDQRDNAAAVANRIYRIDNTGVANLTDVPVLSFPDISTPGQITYSARFTNLSGTRALGFVTGAFTTATNAANVPQTTAPNASTAG